ncbi:MAG TPA: homoserine kinase [Chloroflexota bacterium]|nr:homoserine kinase [Chloroflexota bacterium]
MQPFTVEVPATSANLGPGFDSLGLAVDLVNRVRVEPADRWEMATTGEGAAQLPVGERNLLHRSLMTAARRWDVDLAPMRITCTNAIPLSRGLGSSSAAIVAALVIANRFCSDARSEDELLQIASEIEGHPDNVTPALLGGVQACAIAQGRVVHARVPIPRAPSLALFVPDMPMPTREARRVLPRRVEIHDAVYNISRACLLVAALASGDLDALRVGTEDMLHQPSRMRLFPGMPVLFHAAREGGAVGVYLSGAGSTVIALVDGDATPVANAMARAAMRDGMAGRSIVSTIRDAGARVIAD